MSDNFYEIENNPTTGEDVSRVADVASAQELATMENDMRNREEALKETYEQGTETERNNLEIADGLAQKYPHAFEQTLLPDGSKVTVFKNYLIPEFHHYKYNIITDHDKLFASIDPEQKQFLVKSEFASPSSTFIFSKEGYIKATLNRDTGQFDDPYFKPSLENLQTIIDTTRDILKGGGPEKFRSYESKLKVNNGQNNITALIEVLPLGLADPRLRDMNDLGYTFRKLGNALKAAEIIGEKKQEEEKLSPEEILNLLP
mgnify:CR=1 FL=1